jgi:hypothetical protein
MFRIYGKIAEFVHASSTGILKVFEEFLGIPFFTE